jgi:RHH-type transcriptional regulator, rel operon repressor / antitoxin RelB
VDTTLTVRVPTEMKEQLDHLAEATHGSKSYLAREAIRQYLALELWQVGEIKQALNEADAGDRSCGQSGRRDAEIWGLAVYLHLLRDMAAHLMEIKLAAGLRTPCRRDRKDAYMTSSECLYWC